MTYPTVNATAKITHRWWDGTGHFSSRLFVFMGFPSPDQTILDLCAADIAAAYASTMCLYMSTAYTLDEIQMQDLTTSTGLTGLWSGSHPGADSGQPVDSGTTVDIQAKIDKRYRGGHPCFHHPGPGATWLANPRSYGSVFCTNVHTRWLSYMSGLEAISHAEIPSLVPTVLTGYKNNAAPTDVHPWEIKGWNVRSGLGSMRKRLTSGP